MIYLTIALAWGFFALAFVLVFSAIRHDCERVCYESEAPALDTLAQQIRDWGRITFPTSTPASTAEHLRREVLEILADPTNGEEQADAFFLLVQLARISGNDLAAEVAKKLEINLARKWKPADHLGVVEHVKEEAA